MAAIVQGNELVLTGMVGGSANAEDSWWDPPGFNSGDVVQALATMGADSNILVRLNSGGGIATEGAAIHAALANHKGTVQVRVEGIAASAASLIAMAADTLTMAAGAVFMIHEVSGVTFGNAADHEATIRALNSMGDAYASVYAERTGKPLEEVRELMRAETWMTADEAVAMGFADAQDADAGNDNEPTAFAYGLYSHAPDQLVALANARGWKPRAIAAKPAPQKEPAKMTNPVVETAPVAPPAEDPFEMASICAQAGMTTEQFKAFAAAGGTIEKARAKLEDTKAIKDTLERAKRTNPAITATAEDYIARGLNIDQVRAELIPMLTSNVELSGQHAADVEPKKSLMASAAEEVNKTASRFMPGGKR